MKQQKHVAAVKKALELRKRVKGKKPKFVRQESWRYKRLKENWRRPRGIDNKMRRKIKGWPSTVNAGYRGPKATRGLHPSGYREVLVHNTEEIEGINPKTQAIRIAHTVGGRKRAEILVTARKRGIQVVNLGEIREKAAEEVVETEEKEEEVETEEIVETEETEVKEKKTKKRKRRTKRR